MTEELRADPHVAVVTDNRLHLSNRRLFVVGVNNNGHIVTEGLALGAAPAMGAYTAPADSDASALKCLHGLYRGFAG